MAYVQDCIKNCLDCHAPCIAKGGDHADPASTYA